MNTNVLEPIFCSTASESDWNNGSHRLWSLWEMLETTAWNLVQHTASLTSLRDNLEARLWALNKSIGHGPAEIQENDRANFTLIFDDMEKWLKLHLLTATIDRLDRIREEFEQTEPSVRQIIEGITVLNQTLEDELRRRVFLSVNSEDENLYKNPVASFSLTYAAYPSTRNDIIEACRCHALGRYTASVYHSMAIAESGLHLLAKELGVLFNYPMVLAEWSAVIDGIESKIEPLRHLKRSDEKDKLVTFYSECAVQFRYFKDAWRNHVAHAREVYDRDQSHSILLHVRDFMEKLSLRIKETEFPRA